MINSNDIILRQKTFVYSFQFNIPLILEANDIYLSIVHFKPL